MVTTLPITQSDVVNTPRGADLLNTPTLNKGTAFTEEERTEFGLQGLLPPHVETLDEQAVRAYEAFQRKDNDLDRHIYLRALQDYALSRTPTTFSFTGSSSTTLKK